MSSPVEKDLTVRVQLQKGLQKYLDRSDITEIAVNRPGFVWVEESSGWRCYEDKNFTYDYLAKLGNVCAVYGGENKTLDSAHPVLSVELPDGERAQFVMPPACKNGTISLTVRKISKDVIGLDSYIQNGYPLTRYMRNYLPFTKRPLTPIKHWTLLTFSGQNF